MRRRLHERWRKRIVSWLLRQTSELLSKDERRLIQLHCPLNSKLHKQVSRTKFDHKGKAMNFRQVSRLVKLHCSH